VPIEAVKGLKFDKCGLNIDILTCEYGKKVNISSVHLHSLGSILDYRLIAVIESNQMKRQDHF
jgi:hypothetical protein